MVSWTSACLLLDVAKVREAWLVCLPVRSAERAKDCLSIVYSRRRGREQRKDEAVQVRAKQLSLNLKILDVLEALLRQQSSLEIPLLRQRVDWLSGCARYWRIK